MPSIKTSIKSLLGAAILTAFALATSTPAHADSLSISFDAPNQTATAGGTLDFTGTITNTTGSTVFLNSYTANLDGYSFTLDGDDDFFGNVPVSLAAGETSADIELFSVLASNPFLDAPGLYAGSYTLVGGADGNAGNNLGSSSFSVSIPSASPVPEPSSIYLLATGAALIALPLARRYAPRLS